MVKNQARKKIDKLKKMIEHHSKKYYVDHEPEISDYEFDQLMHELQELEDRFPQFTTPDSPTQRVGSDISNEFPTKSHLVPMQSLDNVYSFGELQDYLARTEKNLGKKKIEYVLEQKIDGVSINLIYEDGYLQTAITRGDASAGDEITRNVKTIHDIPLNIEYKKRNRNQRRNIFIREKI